MLPDSVYEKACSVLAGRSTCCSLLEHLWPLVKDHDFFKGDLVISKPVRVSQGSSIYYSHSIIRETLMALGLKPIHLENKNQLTIKLAKTTKCLH